MNQNEKFDLVTSMDTMYFAPDMSALLIQIMRWLKRMVLYLSTIKRVM